MTIRLLGVWVAAGLGFGVLTAGCGTGSSSPAAPTSPSASSTPSTSSGATIRGIVLTGKSAASRAANVHAQTAASGVRVSVVGTSLATQTDSAGGFELQGVPGGTARLRFEAVEAQGEVEIEGLDDGRTMSIEVHLSADGALIASTDDARNETSLHGRIDAINGSQIQVRGQVVQTDGLTQFLGRDNESIALEALRVGDEVEIEGASQGDGSVYARVVKLEDASENEPPENEVSFRGRIEGLSPFRVAGRTVTIDGQTRILDHRNAAIPFSALSVGNTVEVEGRVQTDGSVLARKIKLED